MGMEFQPFHQRNNRIGGLVEVNCIYNAGISIDFQFSDEIISEVFKHGFKTRFDFPISKTEIVDAEVYAGIDGPRPFKRKNSIQQRLKSLRNVLNMIKPEEFRRFIFFYQVVDQINGHVFFGFEIMDDQRGVDIHAFGDFADGSTFESFLNQDLIVIFENLAFAAIRLLIFTHDFKL